jgi:Ser/Thr protein kinase RdoA (MazF antagonist)
MNFVNLVPEILNATTEIITNSAKFGDNQVISHRDLDPKNVIWVGEVPYLIDWEGVGFVNAGEELASLALDWSNGGSEELFRACIKGYREILAIQDAEISGGLLGALNGKCRWLEYNIRRALGIATKNKDEMVLGNSECVKTIEDIRKTLENIPKYKKWIEGI